MLLAFSCMYRSNGFSDDPSSKLHPQAEHSAQTYVEECALWEEIVADQSQGCRHRRPTPPSLRGASASGTWIRRPYAAVPFRIRSYLYAASHLSFLSPIVLIVPSHAPMPPPAVYVAVVVVGVAAAYAFHQVRVYSLPLDPP